VTDELAGDGEGGVVARAEELAGGGVERQSAAEVGAARRAGSAPVNRVSATDEFEAVTRSYEHQRTRTRGASP